MKLVPKPTPEYASFLNALKLALSDVDIISFGLRIGDEIAVTVRLPNTEHTMVLIFALTGELIGTTETVRASESRGQSLVQKRFLEICSRVRSNREFFAEFCRSIQQANFWIHENFEIEF